jgi:hypothetical protein
MSGSTRRELLTGAAAAGAAALGVSAAAAQEPKGKKPRKGNNEAPVHSKASADEHGPRELFAVVDTDGTLRRGMHVAACGAVDIGIYEVIFKRDVRRGVYLATIGGHGYAGLPPTGYVSVQGRSTNPRAVLVSTCNTLGENVNMGFHLLVVCPDGYA